MVPVNFHTLWGPNLKVPMFCKIEICIKLCVFIIDSKFRALKQQQQLLSSGITDLGKRKKIVTEKKLYSRDWSPKFETGLTTIIGIVQKV